MPLLDHFHAPLYPVRRWESFHALWASALVEQFNQYLLPTQYFAEAQVLIGARIEVDVATLELAGERRHVEELRNGGVATETLLAPSTSMVMPAIFPDVFELRVFESGGEASLVAAIELISPGNKDRSEARRAFAAKCVAYLQQGIGLIIVDIVTERHANLHDEVVRLMEQEEHYRFPGDARLYAVAYHPVRHPQAGDQIEIRPYPLAIEQPLPTMPLSLRKGPSIAVDFEAAYTAARERSRL